MSTLFEWLRSHGGEVSSIDWPIDFGVSNGGRGVGVPTSGELVKSKTVLLSVPKAVMFTTSVALRLLSAAFPDSPLFTSSGLNDIGGEAMLAAAILLEKSKGVESAWQEWLMNLPVLTDYDTILEAWPLEYVELLAIPSLLTRMAARPSTRRDAFAKLLSATNSIDGRCCPYDLVHF
jgi:hypothetical protein